jgi:hypothetical protein
VALQEDGGRIKVAGKMSYEAHRSPGLTSSGHFVAAHNREPKCPPLTGFPCIRPRR